jgi:hypothetical protein
MNERQEQDPQPIKVTDKRKFTEQGQRRPEAPASERAQPCGQPQSPAIDFASFVTSLSTAALLHLGEFENPETGKRERNLVYARQHVEIISMLREKTAGNLSADEQRLIDALLAELQIKYVKACSGED